jgi:hypothetical protein
MAVGIHKSPGGKPPMSHRVYALNSFVLPVHEVDVIMLLSRVNARMDFIQLTIRLVLSKNKSFKTCHLKGLLSGRYYRPSDIVHHFIRIIGYLLC